MSVVLYEPTPLNPRQNDILGFSEPFFNGIFIVSPDLIANTLESPLYGDEMTMLTWANLGMMFGTPSSGTKYTLKPGWLYIYNLTDHIFTITDETGANVTTKYNVKTIDDLCIDFSVHKSHQFQIVFDINDENFPFLICAKLKKRIYDNYHNEFNLGIENSYPADRVRPYGKDDSDNPAWRYKQLSQLTTEHSKMYKKDSETHEELYTGIGKYDIYFDDIDSIPIFYENGVETVGVEAEEKKKTLYAMQYTKFLLGMLSISLIEKSMPVIRDGETNNNRPLYEPWLLYELELAVARYIEDIDNTYPILVFDLSPSWA